MTAMGITAIPIGLIAIYSAGLGWLAPRHRPVVVWHIALARVVSVLCGAATLLLIILALKHT